MAETYETLREVGVAIDGVRGELSSLKWIIGGLGGVGVLFGGFLMTKLDAVEATNARNSAILERIETAVNRTAFNTDEIRERIQTASVPGPEVFPGWKGVPLAEFPSVESLSKAVSAEDGKLAAEGWLYFPK